MDLKKTQARVLRIASRRIGAALLQGNFDWVTVGKVVQDIATIKDLGLKGQDSSLQPLVLLLWTVLVAFGTVSLSTRVEWPIVTNGFLVTDLSSLQALQLTALSPDPREEESAIRRAEGGGVDPAHTEVGIDLRQNEGEELRVPHVAIIIAALEAVQVLAEAHDTRNLSMLVQLYCLQRTSTTETSSVHSVRSSISTEDVAHSVSEAAGQVLVKLGMKLRQSNNATGDASKAGQKLLEMLLPNLRSTSGEFILLYARTCCNTNEQGLMRVLVCLYVHTKCMHCVRTKPFLICNTYTNSQ